MMLQGTSGAGYSVPPVPNLHRRYGIGTYGYMAGAIEEDGKGIKIAIQKGEKTSLPFVRILVESIHLRTRPSIKKDAQSGSKAKRGEVYSVVATGYDKSSNFEEHKAGAGLKEGEYEYQWALLADPKDRTALKGWVTATDVMKIDGKPVLLQDVDFHPSVESASTPPTPDLIAQVETAQKMMEAKEKAMEQKPSTSTTSTTTTTIPVPSAGLGTGAKVAIALGAALVAYLVVSKAGK